MDYGCIEGYLAKKLAGKLNETLLRSPSTLIIDGDAWSGYLLRSDHVFGLEFGGNYDMIHQAICYEVERTGTSLRDYCSGAPPKAHFPTWPLVRQQIIATLKSLAAVLIYCEGDVVQEIAKIVAERNAVFDHNQRMNFALGRNSDFMAMKDCPYIEVDALRGVSIVDQWGHKTFQAEADVVLTRRNLCALLHISEEQFLDWFLLIKLSTSTVGYNRSTDFNIAVPIELMGSSPEVLDALLRIIVSNGAKRLHGAACDRRDEARAEHLRTLQIRLTELRSFYNLLSSPDCNQGHPIRQRAMCSVFAFDYFERGAPDGYFICLAQYIGFATSGGENTTSGADGTIAELALQFTSSQAGVANSGVGYIHFAALRVMLQQLTNVAQAQQRGETVTIVPSEVVPPERPQWGDVIAAFVFQNTCAKIRELLPVGAFGGRRNTPEQSFHGALFHAIMKQMRLQRDLRLQAQERETPLGSTTPPTTMLLSKAVTAPARALAAPVILVEPPKRRVVNELTKIIGAGSIDVICKKLPAVKREKEPTPAKQKAQLKAPPKLATAAQKACYTWVNPSKYVPEVDLPPALTKRERRLKEAAEATAFVRARFLAEGPAAVGAAVTVIEEGTKPRHPLQRPLSKKALKRQRRAAEAAQETAAAAAMAVSSAGSQYAALFAHIADATSSPKKLSKLERKLLRAAVAARASKSVPSAEAVDNEVIGSPAEVPDDWEAAVLDLQDPVEDDADSNNEPPVAPYLHRAAPNGPATALPISPVLVPSEALPIDHYRDAILQRVGSDRVVFITGEAGCGKTTRLPRILLEHAEATGAPCYIMVSQPHASAVTSVLAHLVPVLGDKVRDIYEVEGRTTEGPVIKYAPVDTLVDWLCQEPEMLESCTHLIIDEVHERSLANDMLWRFASVALMENPELRVVLMSTSIESALYREYTFPGLLQSSMQTTRVCLMSFASNVFQRNLRAFGCMECLSVGQRRYPVQIHYAEDLVHLAEKSREKRAQCIATVRTEAAELAKATKTNLLSPYFKLRQFKAAVNLVASCCAQGATVLMFLGDFNDITEMALLFDVFKGCWVLPLHGYLTAEEQSKVLQPTPPNKLKVVLTTSEWESSLFIPDCDTVICLGTHQACRPAADSRQRPVESALISKVSAGQRAGRTGRTRPGTVYRLYPRTCFAAMDVYSSAYVQQAPLAEVVLSVARKLPAECPSLEGAVSLLSVLIQPPPLHKIQETYDGLFALNLITEASGDGTLTDTGRGLSALPLSPMLNRMIKHAVMLGVAAEVVAIIALRSLPSVPFQISIPNFASFAGYNNNIRRKFLASEMHDEGCYSEPIMWLRILLEWRSAADKAAFCRQHFLERKAMVMFSTAVGALTHLLKSSFPPVLHSALDLPNDAGRSLTPSKVNLLRLILTWASSGNIMMMEPVPPSSVHEQAGLKIGCTELLHTQLKALFGTVPYDYGPRDRLMEYHGNLTVWDSHDFFAGVVDLLNRLTPLADEQRADAYWIIVESRVANANFAVVVTPSRSQRTLLDIPQFATAADVEENAQVAQALRENAPSVGTSLLNVLTRADPAALARIRSLTKTAGRWVEVVVPIEGLARLCTNTSITSGSVAHRVLVDCVEMTPESTNTEAAGPAKCDWLRFPVVGTTRASLIDDLPQGYRLIKCCLQGKKVLHLVLERKRSEGKKEAKVTAGLAESINVPLDCITPVWRNLPGIVTLPATSSLESEPEQPKVTWPHQSIMSCSANLGSEPLFAASLRIIGSKKKIFCEMVSFLPPGPTWLQLALLCVGADADAVLEACPDHTSEATERQLELAAQVEEKLYWAHDIVPRPDIVELIDELFLSPDGAQNEADVLVSTED